MKKLTKEEFQDRIEAVSRARKIFIPSITKNISIAFELYQEVLAENERQTFVSTAIGGKRTPTIMDNFVRPICPDCGNELRLRTLPEKGLQNLYGFKTQWICNYMDIKSNEYCGYEQNPSMKTVEDWMKELKKVKED